MLPPQTVEWRAMAPKQRQIRIEQRGSIEAIHALEQRSDEELEAETKYRSAALAILGARAAERFDAEQARGYFQRAIAAARPQERMQLRRMADASLALAERRAGDLKDAVERLGQAPPSGRQMFALRAIGLLVPPASAGILARLRGIALIIVLIAVLLAIGLGVVELVSLPFGGLGLAPALLLGLFVAIAAIAVVAAIGRRRRDRGAKAPAQ
jgi:tetratricopeptide (TPR) repeat protein